MEHKEFAELIIGLSEADLKLRDQLIKSQQLGKGYNQEMASLHSINAGKLNEIIDTIGYPTIEKVGQEACEAAWMIIQHSIGQPVFMKRCAKLLEILAQENQAYLINLAYLTDRIAVFEDQPQQYGTQFDWDEKGQLSPNIFDDDDKVNQRRASIGLNTLEEQTALIRRRAEIENQSISEDFEERKKEIANWKKSVGWTK
ncbi:MAG: DUF6624 domain-containing protein [Pedobacter sp.]|uniref:DUF6624 domain-containing protein n=1 Tax=Pedobacter sp. TaxID=1411316 RepID=UPI00339954AA